MKFYRWKLQLNVHFLSITECTERAIKRNANKLFFLGGGTLTRKLYANMNHRHLTSHYQLCFAKFAKTLQSCLTLCNPIDGSPPGSPIPGILQARTLEWVATSFSDASKWKVKVKSLSRARLVVTPWGRSECSKFIFIVNCYFDISLLFSRLVMSDSFATPWTAAHLIPLSHGCLYPSKNAGVGCYFLL